MSNLAATHAIKADAPRSNSLFVEVQPGWTIFNINELLLELFGAEALAIENNPALAHVVLITEHAATEMIQKEGANVSRMFGVMPTEVAEQYDILIGYMLAFNRHAHSGLCSRDVHARNCGEHTMAWDQYGKSVDARNEKVEEA